MKRAFFDDCIFSNNVRARRETDLFQKFFYLLLDIGGFLCRLKTGDNLTFLVDEEFREVPFDVGLLFVVGIGLGEHVVENMGDGVLHIPAGEALLLLEEEVEGIGIVAIDLDLLEARELSAEVQLAELMDALVGAGSLLPELVAREVENLETLGMVFLVEFFQFVVLGCETTLCCRIDDQQHLVSVLLQGYVLAFSVLDSEVINCFHLMLKL